MSEQRVTITQAAWEERYEKAKQFMQTREQRKKILIEIAAEHPLVMGMYPGEEFSQRLLLGKELFEQRAKQGYEVEIYAPGSRHMYQGVADKISLSEAGMRFLLEQKVPQNMLHGDNLNERYKGAKGVYNSADECFVATAYFKDGEFGQLYSIISPEQLYRKALHYIWFGVLPLFYTAPITQTAHSYIREIYQFIPYVRDVDPDLQSEDSYYGNLFRKERRPKDDTESQTEP